ncbi:rab-GTPase-TBC domain-containing protein, partial [Dunaliella salina]
GVGYTQGMNFVAAVLLMHAPSEEEAFYCLVSLVEDVLPGYYAQDMRATQVDQLMFGSLLRRELPALGRHLQALGADVACCVFVQWFLCLFVNCLPLDGCLRVWDIAFRHRSVAPFFQVALALFATYSPALLVAKDMLDAFQVVQAMAPLTQDMSHVVHVARSQFAHVDDDLLEELREEVWPEVARNMAERAELVEGVKHQPRHGGNLWQTMRSSSGSGGGHAADGGKVSVVKKLLARLDKVRSSASGSEPAPLSPPVAAASPAADAGGASHHPPFAQQHSSAGAQQCSSAAIQQSAPAGQPQHMHQPCKPTFEGQARGSADYGCTTAAASPPLWASWPAAGIPSSGAHGALSYNTTTYGGAHGAPSGGAYGAPSASTTAAAPLPSSSNTTAAAALPSSANSRNAVSSAPLPSTAVPGAALLPSSAAPATGAGGAGDACSRFSEPLLKAPRPSTLPAAPPMGAGHAGQETGSSVRPEADTHSPSLHATDPQAHVTSGAAAATAAAAPSPATSSTHTSSPPHWRFLAGNAHTGSQADTPHGTATAATPVDAPLTAAPAAGLSPTLAPPNSSTSPSFGTGTPSVPPQAAASAAALCATPRAPPAAAAAAATANPAPAVGSKDAMETQPGAPHLCQLPTRHQSASPVQQELTMRTQIGDPSASSHIIAVAGGVSAAEGNVLGTPDAAGAALDGQHGSTQRPFEQEAKHKPSEQETMRKLSEQKAAHQQSLCVAQKAGSAPEEQGGAGMGRTGDALMPRVVSQGCVLVGDAAHDKEHDQQQQQQQQQQLGWHELMVHLTPVKQQQQQHQHQQQHGCGAAAGSSSASPPPPPSAPPRPLPPPHDLADSCAAPPPFPSQPFLHPPSTAAAGSAPGVGLWGEAAAAGTGSAFNAGAGGAGGACANAARGSWSTQVRVWLL